jgi:hypothetical protein
MSDPYRHQFVQASDDEELLEGVSKSYITTNFRDDTNFRISIVIYAASGLTGYIQGGIYDEDGGDIQWADIDGGDLSNYASGGAVQLTSRFDEIRVNVTGGEGKVRIMY